MEETLKLILSEIKSLKTDMSELRQDVTGLKGDVTDLKQDVTGLKGDVTDLKQDVNDLKEDVSSLNEGQERIENNVDNLLSELRSNFKYTNDKLDEHRHIFDVVSNEMKGVKVDIDYLSSKTGKHDMELNNILNRLKG